MERSNTFPFSSRPGEAGGMKKVAMGRSTTMINHPTNSIHAEDAGMNKLNSINNFRRILTRKDKIDIFVIRITKTGVVGNSRPCRNCINRLSKLSYKINHVYYTTNEGDIVRERFKDMPHSPLTKLSSGDRHKQCMNLKRSDKHQIKKTTRKNRR